MQHQFYSSKLQLSHAFLRLSLNNPSYLSEAQTIFELSMKKILATTGHVLHTKVYKETDAQGTV